MAVYATLVISVYVSRLSAYVEKYVDPERFVERLSARPLLLPLLVFASALVGRVVYLWRGEASQ